MMENEDYFDMTDEQDDLEAFTASEDVEPHRHIKFMDYYDDYAEGEYYAGTPKDYSLSALLTGDNARFWSFESVTHAAGLPDSDDSLPAVETLVAAIEGLFRQAVYLFDDDITALFAKSEVPISDPLMDAVDDEALEFVKDLRFCFFVDIPAPDFRMLVVPMELRKIFSELSVTEDFDAKRHLYSQVVNYAQGMTILNGIVLPEDIVACIGQNTEIRIATEDIESILRSLAPFYDLLGFHYDPERRTVLHAALFNDEDIDRIWKTAQHYPAFLPDADTLWNGRNNAFYPTTQEYKKFEKYVSRWHFAADEGYATMFLVDFGQAISMGASMKELLALCEDYDMDMEEDFDKFMSLASDVIQTARRWDLRGHTAQELQKKQC